MTRRFTFAWGTKWRESTKKTCPGCRRKQYLEGCVSAAEHPDVSFEICAECCTLLVGTNPGYPWRLKLLVALERHRKLKPSQRCKLRLNRDGEWVDAEYLEDDGE